MLGYTDDSHFFCTKRLVIKEMNDSNINIFHSKSHVLRKEQNKTLLRYFSGNDEEERRLS